MRSFLFLLSLLLLPSTAPAQSSSPSDSLLVYIYTSGGYAFSEAEIGLYADGSVHYSGTMYRPLMKGPTYLTAEEMSEVRKLISSRFFDPQRKIPLAENTCSDCYHTVVQVHREGQVVERDYYKLPPFLKTDAGRAMHHLSDILHIHVNRESQKQY